MAQGMIKGLLWLYKLGRKRLSFVYILVFIKELICESHWCEV
jgi:hypothetical protein